jgi:putative ABC transport system permease protein
MRPWNKPGSGWPQFWAWEWNAQLAGNPFRYAFMDSDFDNLYKKEDKFGKTIEYFSILAIFIACLGLLGLSSYTTEMRRKEIGIRKVNGASTVGLIGLLTKEFSVLILIAFALSVPVAYYFSNLWLDNFAYKADVGISIFIWAGAASLIIALLTVSYHTIRAAMSNPIDSLRHD